MPTCFVIQGFGKKTDYTDGRVLDLDASYAVIKEAVLACGMECLRADEIVHSGTIDLPMYEQLLGADLVIADLSTYNVNAAFELGVRYGLRPHATVVVAEEGFKPVFDVTHIAIRRYKHLGEDIGLKEAKRFQAELREAIQKIVAAAEVDSPVYTFLKHLDPPQRRVQQAAAAVEAAAVQAARDLKEAREETTPPAVPAPGEMDRTCKQLLDLAQQSMRDSDFVSAQAMLQALHQRRPHDHHVVHQLALATYKGQQPTPQAALLAAKALLERIDPATTNDPETLGLWGAVHKRLWDLEPADLSLLDRSIEAYARGFNLKQDHYNGVNYATLLEVRALQHARAGRRDDAVADRVLARRVRQDVLRYLAPAVDAARGMDDLDDARRYWLLASAWESHAGLGDAAQAAACEARARATQPHGWMLQSTLEQIARIKATQAELQGMLAAG